MSLIKTSYDRMVALKGSELSIAHKSIYLYICEVCSWKSKVFNMRQKRMAEELNMPISTLQKYLKVLEEQGYILRYAHNQSYAGHINKTSFIYPLKYLDVIFNKCDIMSITDNALKEINKTDNNSRLTCETIRKVLLDIRKDLN